MASQEGSITSHLCFNLSNVSKEQVFRGMNMTNFLFQNLKFPPDSTTDMGALTQLCDVITKILHNYAG